MTSTDGQIDDNKSDKEGFYVEGYIKEIAIQSDNIQYVKIDPDVSFKIRKEDKDLMLFISNKTHFAVLHGLNEQTAYEVKIDAASILMLKLHHSKLRFEFDSNCQYIRKVTVI